MDLRLTRPKPALPNSYFWTNDSTTNWVLDDPGVYNFGCDNRYLKKPETYPEDYRRLTDLCADIGIRAITVWGFLRDSHGGTEYAKRVAGYAASKGVSIMAGVGTTWYGGPYYDGDHKYNLETFLKRNPSAGMTGKDQWWTEEDFKKKGVCPSQPIYKEWIGEGIDWLFREFDIGGVNLENGDFSVCRCPECSIFMAGRPQDEPEFYTYQYLGYMTALDRINKIIDIKGNKLVTWATYTGFMPGDPDSEYDKTAYLHCQRPSVFDRIEDPEVTQWTLSGMLLEKPLPLDLYLDNGSPEQAFDNPKWPADLRPPSRRGIGFAHQGSQWTENRYDQVVSSIKEACLRAYSSGLEGVSIHGEVSASHIPAALNYLAFSHFTHWPEDTLRDFGKKTLGEIFHNEREGVMYAEIFSHWDSGTITEDDIKQTTDIWNDIQKYTFRGNTLDIESNITRLRFWYWLRAMLSKQNRNETQYEFRKPQDRHTVSYI
jgi:hypothetical protein